MGIELLTPYTKVELEEKSLTGRRQIGIFAGSFDPITMAHLTIADQVRQSLKLERVLFMPEYDDDEGTIVNMLTIALQGHEGMGIDVSRIETHDSMHATISKMVDANPDTEFYVIAGTDVIAQLAHWDNIAELAKLVTFVGVQRPRYRIGVSLPIIWVDVPQYDISSDAIREMFARGIRPSFMVPDKVLRYIDERGLYL
jgi:nicotinate-nucleotide adenylyltransferase